MALRDAKDSVWLGLVLGLMVPGVLAVPSWFLIHHVRALTGANLLYIFCIAANILVLKYLYSIEKELAGKGVISATFVCAFIFYFYKVLG